MAAKRLSPAPAEQRSASSGPRMAILHGKDRFLQDEKLEEITAALVKHSEGGIITVRFDGQQGPRIVADILDECRSFGLMQQHKIVLVDNADLLVKASDDQEDSGAPPARAGKRGHAPASAPANSLRATPPILPNPRRLCFAPPRGARAISTRRRPRSGSLSSASPCPTARPSPGPSTPRTPTRPRSAPRPRRTWSAPSARSWGASTQSWKSSRSPPGARGRRSPSSSSSKWSGSPRKRSSGQSRTPS